SALARRASGGRRGLPCRSTPLRCREQRARPASLDRGFPCPHQEIKQTPLPASRVTLRPSASCRSHTVPTHERAFLPDRRGYRALPQPLQLGKLRVHGPNVALGELRRLLSIKYTQQIPRLWHGRTVAIRGGECRMERQRQPGTGAWLARHMVLVA